MDSSSTGNGSEKAVRRWLVISVGIVVPTFAALCYYVWLDGTVWVGGMALEVSAG